MSHVERAVDYVKQRGFARTTDLAKLLGMIPGDVDLILAGKDVFVTCDVQVGDSKLKEYRLSTSPSHNFRAGTPIPPTPPGQASAVPSPIAHKPAAPVPGAPIQEKFMAEKKPLVERVLEALKKQGELHVDEIARHAGTTKGTLNTMVGTLIKKHGVVRISRGVYGLGTKAPKDLLAAGANLGRRAAPVNSPYAAVLLDLEQKRAAKQMELTKIEGAIEAVRALA